MNLIVDSTSRRSARQQSPLALLLSEPSRFTFDAAVALMMRVAGAGHPHDAIRFQAVTGLGFIPSDILDVQRDKSDFRATVGFLGLTGSSGVLPRLYTELANREYRHHSAALGQFLDIIAQRSIAHFAAAGIKYRPHRAADTAAIVSGGHGAPRDGLREVLLALAGYPTEADAARLAVGPEPLLFYASAFSAYPRSADHLAGILSDWLGNPVTIEQFAGSWLKLERDQMSMLPSGDTGQFNRLGVDVSVGARAWDIQSRIMIKIGPLDLETFRSMTPVGKTLKYLMSLVRAYLSGDIVVAVNPILAADAVPPIALSLANRSRLGWDMWLPVAGKREADAADALFEASQAEVVS